ncbi:MAG: hypothetical protein IJL21_01925 [Alphaproteobacteria bacterium]|nr:hypothetical protein [Alphaproteobacteria bacterium]
MTKKICHKFPSREGWRVAPAGVWFAAFVALFVATPSFAVPTELDKKTVASKAYVDTKQDIIETGLVSVGDDWIENLPSVVSFDSTSGLVGNKYGILHLDVSMDYMDDGWKNYVGDSEVEYLIPTVGAVARELQNIFDYLDWSLLPWSVLINNTPDNGATQTAAINAYNTTFGNGTNNWAGQSTDLINGQFLANSLALKQNKITTGLVEFEGDDATINVPSVVTTNVAGTGLSGNQIGFMTLSALNSTSTPFGDFAYENNGDNFVPSAALVASRLEDLYTTLWDAMPFWTALTWNSAETTSTNAYETKFVGDTGATANAWPSADKTKLINTAALAQGLALKQNKLPAQDTNLVPGQQVMNNVPSSVLAPTVTAGVVQQVALWDADGGDSASWDLDEYTSNATERTAIRQSIPTVGAVEVGLDQKQNKMTCAGWDSETHTDEHCWLWSIAE